jgi:hypothetical protein
MDIYGTKLSTAAIADSIIEAVISGFFVAASSSSRAKPVLGCFGFDFDLLFSIIQSPLS